MNRRWIVLGLTALVLLTPLTLHAQTSGGILGFLHCNQVNSLADKEPCGINDFLNLFVYLAQWGLSIVAVLASLMFVYGGFQFITAGGRSSKVDEGKRVIQGTIIGIIISLAAYVIINFVVSAITGTRTNSLNPFAGPIATVFGNQKGLSRPFSGAGSGEETRGNNCRSTNNTAWDKQCTQLQVWCADQGTGSGQVTNLQTQLNNLGCNCGTADGCYGQQTVDCVRRFQVANNLPLTGAVDGATSLALDGPPIPCDFPNSQASAVVDKLPKATPASASGASGSGQGCCIVKNADTDLYCLDAVSPKVCNSLGSANDYYESSPYCLSTPPAAGRCGFCQTAHFNGEDNENCFQLATPYWCTNVAQNTSDASHLLFLPNRCDGSACAGNICRNTILVNPR